jgi:hypothetical protein
MMTIKQLVTRQRIRKGLLLVSFLLFPITLYYFSPALILAGAAQGAINGSFLVFSLSFWHRSSSGACGAAGRAPPVACRIWPRLPTAATA